MRRSLLVLTLVLAGCGNPQTAPPLVSPSTPVFADLTAADADSAVRVLAFDPVAASTVVEPVILLSGRDFCDAYEVPPTDKRCAQPEVIEESRIKVTLPLDPQVTLPAGFAELLRERPAPLARVTVRGGVVVGLTLR